MALEPLIAEAKERMRRRRSLVALVIVVAGLVVGLAFALRSSGPGSSGPLALTSSLRAGDLRVSLPQGFNTCDIRGGIYRVGTRPPLIGHVLANWHLPTGSDCWKTLDYSAAVGGRPANGVALDLDVSFAIGPVSDGLHLPLTPGQHGWFTGKLANGAVGPRYGWFRFHNADYRVMYWIGPDASARDRDALVRALESIRPAR
jgi:hypothetical protein